MGDRETGQEAFFFGELMSLRLRLGLSKQALADILGVTVTTLYRWEGPGMLSRLNDKNAERVALFVRDAEKALEEWPDFSERFTTLARKAQYMGVTQEFLFHQVRDGYMYAEEIGCLGLFAPR